MKWCLQFYNFIIITYDLMINVTSYSILSSHTILSQSLLIIIIHICCLSQHTEDLQLVLLDKKHISLI